MLNGAVGPLVLDTWSFADWAFPTYVLTMSALTMTLITVAPRISWLTRHPYHTAALRLMLDAQSAGRITGAMKFALLKGP